MSKSLRKGNKVIVRMGATMWKPTTSADHKAWRDSLDNEAARRRARGEDVFTVYNDEGGEPRLAPRSKVRDFTEGEWTVVKSRVAVDYGWHPVRGACLLRHTDGTEWYAHRRDVCVVHHGEGPKPKVRVLEGGDADIRKWADTVGAKYKYKMTIEWGRKYAKLMVGSRVYCFVDRGCGDILKAASRTAPAKHARGNIYDPDPLKGVNSYGAAYLR